MALEAVLFDFDGVVLDTSDQLFQGYKKIFDRYNAKYTEKDFNEIYGLKTKEHFKKIFLDNNIKISNTEVNELVTERDEYYRELCSKNLKALPGVNNLLKELKNNGLKVGLASSSSKGNLNFLLPKIGLYTYFDQIIAGTDVSNGKPNPEIYLKTCERLEVNPSDCVGIEDTEIGVNALKNASIKSIVVTLTNRRQYNFSKADLVIRSLEEIDLEKIKSLF